MVGEKLRRGGHVCNVYGRGKRRLDTRNGQKGMMVWREMNVI